MDLAIYIRELLRLTGEVTVPGIGCFRQQRINGYYSEHENRLYPPRHQLLFEPLSADPDNRLARYISETKNISPASARYFIEKYAMGLKQQAAEQKVDMTGLGHLYYENSELTFQADTSFATNDPAFFGLAPVALPGTAEKSENRAEAPAGVEIPVSPSTTGTAEGPPGHAMPGSRELAVDTLSYLPQESLVEPDAEPARQGAGSRLGIIVLLLLIAGLLAFGAAYQYKPEWFGHKRAGDTVIIVKKALPARPDTSKRTEAKNSVPTRKDSVSAVKPSVDTFALRHYEILGGAFRTPGKLRRVMSGYRRMGLRPRLLPAKGRYQLITLGTYFDLAQARRIRDSIKNIPGIIPGDINLETYNPKK